MNRPSFKDFEIPAWRKYDPGYVDIPLKEYISELEKYIEYLEKQISKVNISK